MPRNGAETRSHIMDTAQELILLHGFSATTIDAVVEKTGLTKGAFFHHFKSKSDLGHAIMERFAQRDHELLNTITERAERLTSDPVQRVLVAVGLLEEMAEQLTDPNHGCLFASYAYESQLFDDEVHAIIRSGFYTWRQRLGEMLRAAMAHRPPRMPVDVDELADMLTVVIEGAYVLGKSYGDSQKLARQLLHYRAYLQMLFGVEPRPAAAS